MAASWFTPPAVPPREYIPIDADERILTVALLDRAAGVSVRDVIERLVGLKELICAARGTYLLVRMANGGLYKYPPGGTVEEGDLTDEGRAVAAAVAEELYGASAGVRGVDA